MSDREPLTFDRQTIGEILTLVPDYCGRRVLDVGCGTGVAAREFAGRGARVVGVDASEAMLQLAIDREKQDGLGIDYVRDDVHELAGLEANSFDGAVCNLSLSDVQDLARTLAAVQRVVRPGGWFAFAAEVEADRNRLPLTSYTDALSDAGFSLRSMREPDPETSQSPAFLVVVATRH